MAVVTRIRSGGKKTYYVKFVWNDKEIWERAGHDRRHAKSLNAQRLEEVREGTYRPNVKLSPTFRSYANDWLDGRKNRTRDADRKVIEMHVIGDDKPHKTSGSLSVTSAQWDARHQTSQSIAPAWVHEASANLLALLAGVSP